MDASLTTTCTPSSLSQGNVNLTSRARQQHNARVDETNTKIHSAQLLTKDEEELQAREADKRHLENAVKTGAISVDMLILGYFNMKCIIKEQYERIYELEMIQQELTDALQTANTNNNNNIHHKHNNHNQCTCQCHHHNHNNHPIISHLSPSNNKTNTTTSSSPSSISPSPIPTNRLNHSNNFSSNRDILSRPILPLTRVKHSPTKLSSHPTLSHSVSQPILNQQQSTHRTIISPTSTNTNTLQINSLMKSNPSQSPTKYSPPSTMSSNNRAIGVGTKQPSSVPSLITSLVFPVLDTYLTSKPMSTHASNSNSNPNTHKNIPNKAVKANTAKKNK